MPFSASSKAVPSRLRAVSAARIRGYWSFIKTNDTYSTMFYLTRSINNMTANPSP
jgi:hypothetical protein